MLARRPGQTGEDGHHGLSGCRCTRRIRASRSISRWTPTKPWKCYSGGAARRTVAFSCPAGHSRSEARRRRARGAVRCQDCGCHVAATLRGVKTHDRQGPPAILSDEERQYVVPTQRMAGIPVPICDAGGIYRRAASSYGPLLPGPGSRMKNLPERGLRCGGAPEKDPHFCAGTQSFTFDPALRTGEKKLPQNDSALPGLRCRCGTSGGTWTISPA